MSKLRTRLTAKAALGASAVLLAVALPSAGLAFVSLADSAQPATAEQFIAFTPADADPRLAQMVAERGGPGQLMRFTPAGLVAAPEARSIAVAMRMDGDTSGTIASGAALGSARTDGARGNPLRVTPTRYNLGLARGYSNSAQPAVAAAPATPTLARSIAGADVPDLADFTPAPGVRQEPSRFAARIELDEDTRADNAAVSGERLTDQLLDVGGSYSLTRNLDITAGVRYEQDRDLIPLPDVRRQDSQAVYVGTQFRF